MERTVNLARRNFLRIAVTAISAASCGLSLPAQQTKPLGVSPAETAEPFPLIREENVPRSSKPLSQKEREKDFRDSLEQLSDCIVKVRQNLSRPDSANSFSVQLYKQAEAIERFAKAENDPLYASSRTQEDSQP